jgi:hypothetical protein
MIDTAVVLMGGTVASNMMTINNILVCASSSLFETRCSIGAGLLAGLRRRRRVLDVDLDVAGGGVLPHGKEEVLLLGCLCVCLGICLAWT